MKNYFHFRKISFFILFVIITSSWSSFSQERKTKGPAPSKPVSFKEKKATLNFEDELVEGTTQKPDLFYLFQRKNFNYNKLIKLRENFLPEMRKTTEDIQRVRGAH